MDSFVEKQTEFLCDLWEECDGNGSSLSPLVPRHEKIANEEHLTDLLGWMENRMQQLPSDQRGRQTFSDQLISRAKLAGRKILQFTDEQMDCLEQLGVTRVAGDFFRQARDFDPFLPFDSIFQASRNVWTCNYLQTLMGLPAVLTPSVFAYSMLYPVSDNFLDDPRRSVKDKIEFNDHFSAWLIGDEAVPACWDEEDVRDLVRMIEIQYSRGNYPRVYESLLAIHKAQIKSLKMSKTSRRMEEREITAMTFEKGGTSVLADGFLVAGDLSQEEMEVIFNYGAFAQLMDDQEDIHDDLQAGSCTLFTNAYKRRNTGSLMDKVFQFSHLVLQGLNKFGNPTALPLKQMSMKGIDFLLIDAIQRTAKYYPGSYLQTMEAYYPFRFEYMKRVKKEISRKGFSMEHLLNLILPKRICGLSLPASFRFEPRAEPLINSG